MDMYSTPRLSPGCRLHPTEDVLLVPEGALQLSGPAREILLQLDGQRSIQNIVDALVQQYAGVDAEEIRADVLSLLQRMEQQGAVRG